MKRLNVKSLRNSKLISVVLSLGMLLAVVSPLWAEEGQTADGANTYEEEITVTATRTGQNESTSPGTTEVITKDEAGAANSQTVADAVTDQGITCPSNGGASAVASVQLDGASASQTMVMLNGIPLYEGSTGQVDLNFFPMAGVEMIEIAHGPLSALYGANALGGVVNIITDLTGEPGQTITLGGGSFQNRIIGLELRENQWGLAAGGNWSAGYRPHSDTVSGYFSGQYDLWEQGKEYERLHGLFLSREADIPGSTLYPSQGHQTDEDLMLDLSGRRNYLGGDWEYKLYGQSVQNGFVDQSGMSGDSNNQASRYGFDLAGSYEMRDHQLLGGIQYRFDDYESSMTGSHQQNDVGLFAQDIWTLNGGWTLTTGLRQDYQTDFKSPLTPRINLTRVVNSNFNLKLGYGESFRAPTINERYWNQPQYGMMGNPNLRPELGKRYDLSGEWHDAAGRLTVGYFHADLYDGINWTNNAGTYTPENIDQMVISGLNLSWEQVWNDWLIGRVRYTWLDKEGWNAVTASFNQDLNTFGRQQLNLGLGMRLGSQVMATLNWCLVSGRSKQFGTPMPDYNTGDLNIQYRPSTHWSLAFQVSNLTNQSYEINQGYPMPGQAFMLSAGYTF